MTDNEMYVKNTFTIGGLIVLFVALIVGGIQIHEYQETMKMEACVKAGKEWTKIKVEGVSGAERVCVTK